MWGAGVVPDTPQLLAGAAGREDADTRLPLKAPQQGKVGHAFLPPPTNPLPPPAPGGSTEDQSNAQQGFFGGTVEFGRDQRAALQTQCVQLWSRGGECFRIN